MLKAIYHAFLFVVSPLVLDWRSWLQVENDIQSIASILWHTGGIVDRIRGSILFQFVPFSPVWTLQSSWSPPRNNNSSLSSPMLPPLHTAVELTDHEGFTKIGTHRINFISDGVRQQPYWDILSLSLYLAMVMQAESIAAAAAARETWLGEEQRNSLLARWCWRSWLYCYEGLHSLVESARKSSSMTTCPILWSGYSRTLELITSTEL